jgi:hypothetical protein
VEANQGHTAPGFDVAWLSFALRRDWERLNILVSSQTIGASAEEQQQTP